MSSNVLIAVVIVNLCVIAAGVIGTVIALAIVNHYTRQEVK